MNKNNNFYVLDVDACAPVTNIDYSAIYNGGDTIVGGGYDEEYKWLGYCPSEVGYFPVCSKDRNEWVLCYGAIKDGEKIDVASIGFRIAAEWLMEQTEKEDDE